MANSLFFQYLAGNKSSRQLKKYHNEKVSNLYNTCNPALAGCNNDEKNAQARLDNARSMYEQNEFFAAKNESTASASYTRKSSR